MTVRRLVAMIACMSVAKTSSPPDPFSTLNSLSHQQVTELARGCEEPGVCRLRLVRRGRGVDELVDYGHAASDEPEHRAERFRVMSSLPNRHHTGVVLIDERLGAKIESVSRRRRIRFCVVFAAALAIASLTVVLR